jgi:hypothetical protein
VPAHFPGERQPVQSRDLALSLDSGGMAGGEVTFSGAIELKGLVPDQFALRAEGRSMDLRFPTGFRSTVNASLTLTGAQQVPIRTLRVPGPIGYAPPYRLARRRRR